MTQEKTLSNGGDGSERYDDDALPDWHLSALQRCFILSLLEDPASPEPAPPPAEPAEE